MCTVLLLLRPGDPWPLLVAANRDELLDRPFDSPGRYWPGAPGTVAGRDRLGGGSWFGANDDGVVATIVNGMDRLGPLPGKSSRGELVLRALRERDATDAAHAVALPAAPEAPPVLRFANGPPTRAPYEPIPWPWVRGARVEG